MLIGVDLLWVRHGINGGTESVIRNLLKAFGEIGEEEFLLFVSGDNADSFRAFGEYKNIRLHVCDTDSAIPVRRVLWQNMHEDELAFKCGVDLMFSPIYSLPRFKKGRIPYVAVIHDMQALHYPEYFGKIRNMFFRYSWKKTCRDASRVITISDYCKDEIEKFYPAVKGRITRIYDPVDIDFRGSTRDHDGAPVYGREFEETIGKVLEKYGLSRGGYDYCVSSLLPHKNLDTLLKMKAEFRGDNTPLVISGVGGHDEEFGERIRQLDIDELVLRTGFVSDEERNALYAGCRLFLFPSVFEGFGMPPVEALAFGKRVVMTKEACLREITADKAVYVDDPYDPADWAEKTGHAVTLKEKVVSFPQYDPHVIASSYLRIFRNV